MGRSRKKQPVERQPLDVTLFGDRCQFGWGVDCQLPATETVRFGVRAYRYCDKHAGQILRPCLRTRSRSA